MGTWYTWYLIEMVCYLERGGQVVVPKGGGVEGLR
jgi:hypothetical protein